MVYYCKYTIIWYNCRHISDIVGSVPNGHNKVNIAIKSRVHFGFLIHIEVMFTSPVGCWGYSSILSKKINVYQFSSVTQLCPTLCDPMDCGTPGFPVLYLPELAQTRVHWVNDTIQPSHSLSSPSPPAFNLSQHQVIFQWVSFLHQVAKVLELQPQHLSLQWIFRTDLL